MKNNNLLNENKLQISSANPEKAVRSDDKKQIAIMWTLPIREYAVFNTKTGEQVTPFVNGENGIVEFSNLNPNIKYEVKTGEKGYVEFKNLNPNEKYEVRVGEVSLGDKPRIRQIWSLPLYNDEHKNN